MMMRIGLFGGTFNPIHMGHIQVALKVNKTFSLDKILFIPSALPPHKEPGDVVDVKNRLEMIHRALIPYPGFEISDVELKRPGPSYTIDTVRHFKRIMDEGTTLYLLLGLDAFLEIDTWKSYSHLFLMTPFIVIMRTCDKQNDAGYGWKILEEFLKSRVSGGYKYSELRSCFSHEKKQPIFLFNVAPIDISSTNIRQRIKKGKSIERMVPDVVENFIKNKGLYL
jgi:nicotinate-nucleotide adenylyltransferase